MKIPVLEPDVWPGPDEATRTALLGLLNGNEQAYDHLIILIREARVIRPAWVKAEEKTTEIRREAMRLRDAILTISEIAANHGEAWSGLFQRMSEFDDPFASNQSRALRDCFGPFKNEVKDYLMKAAEANLLALPTKGGRPSKSDAFPRWVLMSGLFHCAQMAGIKANKYPGGAFYKITEIAYPLAGFYINPTNDIEAHVKKIKTG